jgi:amino acid transporter
MHRVQISETVLIILALFATWYAIVNFNTFRRVVIGRPMRTRELYAKHNQLSWLMALPILAADLYSSVAYGPEAGMAELDQLGPSAQWLIIPITASSVGLLIILVLSYIMGILAYPSGGGAYAITKDNFKKPLVSLIASSSLLVDYILTVAVSVSAGVHAVASAYPVIAPYRTSLAILAVLLLVIINLRGVAEATSVFAWPTFLFMGSMFLIIIAGFFNEAQSGFVQNETPPFGTVPGSLTLLLVLRAFSSACSALTGIETISNAVPIFREPQQPNAIKAYIIMACTTGVTLLGYAFHLYVQGIQPHPNQTMLSQLAEQYFGHGIVYQVIIWTTFIVLLMAANSTFTGFAQLAAIVAADGYLPHAFTNRGDRLAYSNGILLLAGFAALLIGVFQAEVNALLPLYAIGVFLSFTVAQWGLCRRWLRVRGRMWQPKLAINLIGLIVTAIVTGVVAYTKFLSGAWVVLIILPLIISFSIAVRRHYKHVADEIRIEPATMQPRPQRVKTIVFVGGVHRVVHTTVSFAKSLDSNAVAVYVGFNAQSIQKMREKWLEWGNPIELVTLESEYRSLLAPLAKYIDKLEKQEGKLDHIHVIMPQFIAGKWWHNLLHNQSGLLIRAWLYVHKNVVVTTVPYHLQD